MNECDCDVEVVNVNLIDSLLQPKLLLLEEKVDDQSRAVFVLGVESGLRTFKEVIISGMGFELSMSLDRNGSLEIGL